MEVYYGVLKSTPVVSETNPLTSNHPNESILSFVLDLEHTTLHDEVTHPRQMNGEIDKVLEGFRLQNSIPLVAHVD